MKCIVNNNKEPKTKGSKMAEKEPKVLQGVQPEVSMEAMADEGAKSGNVDNMIQLPIDRQTLNSITARLFTNAITQDNMLAQSSIKFMDAMGLKYIELMGKTAVVHDAAVAAGADSQVDSSPPDEGERQPPKK